MDLEGIVSKRAGSRYVSGRTRAWLKTKNPISPFGGSAVLCGVRFGEPSSRRAHHFASAKGRGYWVRLCHDALQQEAGGLLGGISGSSMTSGNNAERSCRA
jgi:ATP-dependent DNA ligase